MAVAGRVKLGLLPAALGLPGLAGALRLLVHVPQILLAPIQFGTLLIDRFLFLLDAALDPLDLLAPLRELAVELPTEANRLVFRLERCVTSSGFCFLQDAVGLRLRLAGLGVGAAFQVPPGREEGGNDDERGLEDAEDDGLDGHRHPYIY
jgi:hypothetical protein